MKLKKLSMGSSRGERECNNLLPCDLCYVARCLEEDISIEEVGKKLRRRKKTRTQTVKKARKNCEREQQ